MLSLEVITEFATISILDRDAPFDAGDGVVYDLE